MDEQPARDDVREHVRRYDEALAAGDLVAVDAVFRPGPTTSRFGLDEVTYGSDSIAALRRRRPAAPPATFERADERSELELLCDHVGLATTEYRDVTGARRRRTQVWVRDDGGRWCIAHAHLSVERPPGEGPAGPGDRSPGGGR